MLHELSAAVRAGEVSPTELVERSLRRIEAANPTLNAVVALRAEEALAEAAEHRCTGPLAGLPLLVKDLARCAGMRTTLGSTLFADAAPDEVDDIAVARLRAAGAIVVGRTNSPAFGHAPFTTNLIFGPTRNPWNPERSPGGSSGGSAAALSAALAPLATSSDGGGSARIPAALCGLVGYKPTAGVVGRNVLPRWIELSTMGAMGRSVADVVLEASIIQGTAPGDWTSVPAGTASLTPTRPARIVATRTFRADVDPEIEAAFDDTLATLRGEGFTVETVDAPCSPADALDWFIMASAELAQSLQPLRDRWEELDDSLRLQLAFGAMVTLDAYLAAVRRRHELGARIDDVVGSDGVLVVPTLNARSWAPEGPAPDAAGSVTGDLSIATNTPEINASGHPAVSVPMGFDEHGVPTGLQVIAPRFGDGLALGVAQVLERTRPWALVATGFETF